MSDSFLQPVERDERGVAVENASYRLGFFLLSIAILWDASYRSIFRHEIALDLIALVFASFAVCRIYQARQNVLKPGWLKTLLLFALFCGVIGGVIGAIVSVVRYISFGQW